MMVKFRSADGRIIKVTDEMAKRMRQIMKAMRSSPWEEVHHETNEGNVELRRDKKTRKGATE